MKNIIEKRQRMSGFSLIEMLVVVSVIGVIAGIAVPMLTDVSEQASSKRAVRNAQLISSMYSAAVSAGADIEGSTAKDIADEIIEGVTAPDVEGSFFQAAMSDEERDEALAHLVIDETTGALLYVTNGGGLAAGGMTVGDLEPGVLSLGGAITVFQELEDSAGSVENGQTYVEAMLGALASQAAFEQDLAAGTLGDGFFQGTVQDSLQQAEQHYHEMMAGGLLGNQEYTEEQINDARAAYYEIRDEILQEALANQNGSQFVMPIIEDAAFIHDPANPGDPMDGPPVSFVDQQSQLLGALIANDDGFGGSNVVLTQVQPDQTVYGDPSQFDDIVGGPDQNYGYYGLELQQ